LPSAVRVGAEPAPGSACTAISARCFPRLTDRLAQLVDAPAPLSSERKAWRGR